MEIKDYHLPGSPGWFPPLACRAGDLVFCAGGIPAHPISGVPEDVKPRLGYPYHWSSIGKQIHYIYDGMQEALKGLGSSMKQVMKINTYMSDPSDIYEALNRRKEYFGVDTPPPSTLVLVPELPVRGAKVTTDAIALSLDCQSKRIALATSTPEAPMPPHERIWGHRIYVKATRGGGFIFTSGRTNNVIGASSDSVSVGNPDFPYRDDKSVLATELILQYLTAVLGEMGASLEDVVKVEVHLNRMSSVAGLDEAWCKHFPKDPPARVFVPVEFPNDFAIFEVEFIAVDPEGPYKKETVKVAGLPIPIGHEPQAIQAGPYLFFSGQMATDYKHSVAPEAQVDPNFPFHSSSVKKQVRYILKNVEAVCQACGTSLSNLVRKRAIHTDLNDLGEAEAVWRQVVGDRLPPTTIFRTMNTLPVPGCRVQYDLIAYIPE